MVKKGKESTTKKKEESKKKTTAKKEKEESKKKTTAKKEKEESKKKTTAKKAKEEKEEEEIPVVSKEIKNEPKKRNYNYMTSRTKISNEDCPDFLEGKCKKLFCDKIHNYSKIYKKQNNIEFLNSFSYLQNDFIVLSEYQKKLYANQELDIMFICDCTGSMDEWILAVKEELKSIISYIIENNPFVKIKMSFLGYRDIKDKKRFEIKDFTDDFDSLEKFISGIKAEGGGDVPEDIAGALNEAIKLSWRKKSAKFCILIADAPCHGKKYMNKDYEEYKDDYPDGDPNGLTPEFLIGDLGRNNVNLFFIKIDEFNDKMNEIFNNSYISANKEHSPIIIAELGKNTENLGFIVSVSSNETLNKFTVNNIPLDYVLSAISKENKNMSKLLNDTIVNIQKRKKRVIKINKIILNQKVDESKTYDNFISTNKNEINAICHSFIIKKDRHMNMNWKKPYINHYKVETKCIIDDIPFSEGAERYAYYLYDKEVNLKYVAKLKKEYYESENNLEGYSKDLESITICHHIANEFNERIVNIIPKDKTDILLKYIHCYIYEITSPTPKFYYVENYIPGKYIKYNNNAGWIKTSIADQTLVAQAFSHFSYQFTQGYLMIVDLQGVGGFLTDPQIHCLDEDRFGIGNFGYIGFVKFFLTHKCNKYCKELGLIHPNKINYKIDIDNFEFFVEKYENPKNKKDEIFTICDLCSKPFKIKAVKALDLRKKCWDPFCNECDEKRKKSYKTLKCVRCHNDYMTSDYIWLMKRQPLPNMCQKCKQQLKIKGRNKFYGKK